MALSINTEEADRLARLLAQLTGETMNEAVTRSLRERLDRLRGAQSVELYVAEGLAFAGSIRRRYGRARPVTAEEWDDGGGDDFDRKAG